MVSQKMIPDFYLDDVIMHSCSGCVCDCELCSWFMDFLMRGYETTAFNNR